MSEDFDYKEFWITSQQLLKNSFKTASERIIIGWCFNLLLVCLDYRPAFLNSYGVKGYDFVDIPIIIVKILNTTYPGLFEYSNPLESHNGFIWCHQKPRTPKKVDKIKGSLEQWNYNGEILGYPEPGKGDSDSIRWSVSYYLYLGNSTQCQIVASLVSNLSKIKYKQLVNFNRAAELISYRESNYTVQQLIKYKKL